MDTYELTLDLLDQLDDLQKSLATILQTVDEILSTLET